MPTAFVGRLLKSVRAGEGKTAWAHPATSDAPEGISVTSTAFTDGVAIPQRHAGDGVGDDIAPALSWSGVPAGTRELVLVIEDPDAPLPRPVVHGLFFGIDPRTTELAEGALKTGSGVRIGVGSFKRRGYAGPRPVPGHGPHHYIFELFALDQPSGLGDDATLADVLSAVDGHVIARGRLTGTYER